MGFESTVKSPFHFAGGYSNGPARRVVAIPRLFHCHPRHSHSAEERFANPLQSGLILTSRIPCRNMGLLIRTRRPRSIMSFPENLRLELSCGVRYWQMVLAHSS